MRDTWLRIIDLLGEGQFVSGAALGSALGVSRTTVWKHLNKLEAWGVSIEKSRRNGYRIAGGMELLCHQQILGKTSRPARELVRRLQILVTTESTNNVVRTNIE